MSFSLRVLAARGAPCPYCTEPMIGTRAHHPRSPTRDHVNPRSNGGGSTIMVCQRCNLDKADLTLAAWGRRLRRLGDPRADRIERLDVALKMGWARLASSKNPEDRHSVTGLIEVDQEATP